MTNRYNPDRHHRHSIRLPGWDYRTRAYYFVTICAYQRQNLFDNPAYFELADMMWQLIPQKRHAHEVILDEWVIMPNHLHGLLLLPGRATPSDEEEAILPGLPFDLRVASHPGLETMLGDRPKALPGSLGSIIGTYKSGVTRRINALRRTLGQRVWQRGYYEHIVRDNHELARIQTYIRENPARWAEDRENLDDLLKRMVYKSD